MLKFWFLIICCSCVLTQEATNGVEEIDVFRLPNNTKPLFYTLNIRPIIDPENKNFTFIGDVGIDILVKTSTLELTLNADSLQINSITVTEKNSSQKIKVNNYILVTKNQQLKIQLDNPGLIADQEYNVQITYRGKLRNDMTGFYKSSYKNEEKKTIWLASTNFEPTYARRAFPCYDEPEFKTPFHIYIIRADTQISLSNMPRDRFYQINETPNYICDQYQTTKPMSTYLVAFSVSEFETTKKNQRINAYTHKGYIDQVTYIEEKANKLLDIMEIYTNIPYPYSKLDLLAVPDFSDDAMENWGLNMYREKYLLVTEKSSEKDKEMVITTVQHELSHQWFGNLVTCSWWNYLWLNEAFATLFEYFAVQVVEPDWRVGDMFVIEQHQEALLYDHRPMHPITASVNTPNEIENIFDDITYKKGASVLRMLKHTLNDEIFRSSLTSYLNTYKYKSVGPKHLWDSFDSELFKADYKLRISDSKFTVGEFMSSWTDQPGYPLIHVGMSNDNNELIVTQKRYEVDEPRLNYTTLWHIGLTYTTKKTKEFKNLQPSIWMNNTETKVTIPLTKDAGWVIFNLQSTGFYRVNYDLSNWDLLISELKQNPKSIHVLNRAQLIDDSFNLARAGELSYNIPLNLVSYLDTENDFIPWYSAMKSMSYLVERFRRCPHTGPQMKNFTKKYSEIVYKKVSNLYDKKDEKHFTKTSMNAFSNWACMLEVESCVQSALNYFNVWQKNEVEIPPDVKDAALCVGVKNGTEETWNKVFTLFLNTESTSERQAALLALACSANKIILSKYLDLLLEDDCPIRLQDYKTMITSLASTPLGINVTINFLQNNINQYLKNKPEAEEIIIQMYSTLATSVATLNEIHELNLIRNFSYLTPALKESFNNSYSEVELNSAYYVRSHPLVHQFFSPVEKSSTHTASSAITTSYAYINAIILSLLFVVILQH